MTTLIRAALFGLLLAAPVSVSAGLDIRFDYTYDSSGFFSGANVGRRAILDAAANVFETRLSMENFGSITPSGSNTWSLTIPNPSTGASVTLDNLVVPQNAITIYVGARDLSGTLLGYSSYQYSYSGNSTWVNLFSARDSTTNFDSFGGAISFDALAAWYFDGDVSTLESFPNKYDFYSVAQHEIGHLLGFTDGATAFHAKVVGVTFVGSHVEALYGGAAPLASASDLGHWQQGLTLGGREVVMDPSTSFNQRRTFSELDFAALQDIGYLVSPIPEPGVLALLVFSGGLAGARYRRRMTNARVL